MKHLLDGLHETRKKFVEQFQWSFAGEFWQKTGMILPIVLSLVDPDFVIREVNEKQKLAPLIVRTTAEPPPGIHILRNRIVRTPVFRSRANLSY